MKPVVVLVAERDYVGHGGGLNIAVFPGSPLEDAPGVVATTAVNGTAAVVTRSGREQCVRWSGRPGLAYSVCSYGEHLESVDELVKVADSVRSPSRLDRASRSLRQVRQSTLAS